MSFWEHLDVLRGSLIRIVVVWVVLAVAVFAFVPWLFDNVILAPCRNDFVFYRFLTYIGGLIGADGDFFTTDFNVDIVNIKLASPFLLHISTSFALSFVLTIPYLLWEAWRFVSPGLYPNEKRHVPFVLSIGTLLFLCGVFVGYIMVFPLTLRFLSTYQISQFVPNQITLNSYMDNFFIIVPVMGLVFELPILLWFLSSLGIVSRSLLVKYRRHAYVFVFILAAFITPTGDPFTLMVVALPLCLLYEVGIMFVRKKE